MANSVQQFKNRLVLVGGLTLTEQTTCPIASGEAGMWVDSNGNVKHRFAGGTDTTVAAANVQVIPVDMVMVDALAACTYANGTAGVGATLTGNANGALGSIDGQTIVVNKKILVTGQVAGANNGPYVVTAVGGASAVFVLTRLENFDESAEMIDGTVFMVQAGTTYADTNWKYTTATGPTVGTTALTFSLSPLSIVYGDATDIADVILTESAGVSTDVARADHVHALSVAIVPTWTGAHTFTAAVTQTGATTFGTGTDAVSLNGDTTIAGGKDLLAAAGDGALDFSLGTGITKTTTGANTLSGDTTIAAGKDLLCAAGDTAVDLSLGTGTFKTTTGILTYQGKQAATATINAITDPGNAGAIPVTTDGVCNLTSAGAETRTLAIPTFVGQRLTLCCDVYVGDIVITVASAFNVATNTTITIEAAGNMAELVGVHIGGARRWRLVSNDGCTLG